MLQDLIATKVAAHKTIDKIKIKEYILSHER